MFRRMSDINRDMFFWQHLVVNFPKISKALSNKLTDSMNIPLQLYI